MANLDNETGLVVQQDIPLLQMGGTVTIKLSGYRASWGMVNGSESGGFGSLARNPKQRPPDCDAYQAHATARKDFEAPEGIRVGHALGLWRALA